MKRLVASLATVLCALAFHSPPAAAQATPYVFKFERMGFRNTAASTVTRDPNWTKTFRENGVNTGFADSSVFRKGTATATSVDTSRAYIVSDFLPPPTYYSRGGAPGARAQATRGNTGPSTLGAGLLDSVVVDTTDVSPWLELIVRQDSVTTGPYVLGLPTTFDSIYVAAQFSYDGVIWNNVQGTPTRAFSAVLVTSNPVDGLQPPAVAATESSPGVDEVHLAFQYHPSLIQNGQAPIINRSLGMVPYYVRFLINVCEGQGQFAVELGSWRLAAAPSGSARGGASVVR